ncbi:MAG: hypothetical protein LBB93_02790, partial [Elusimicrobiota bacterium]|nr:hypothetical protein [Elusimicrobiota bacterium]
MKLRIIMKNNNILYIEQHSKNTLSPASPAKILASLGNRIKTFVFLSILMPTSLFAADVPGFSSLQSAISDKNYQINDIQWTSPLTDIAPSGTIHGGSDNDIRTLPSNADFNSILIPTRFFTTEVPDFSSLQSAISDNNYQINLTADIQWINPLTNIASSGTIHGGTGNDIRTLSSNAEFNAFSLESKQMYFVGNLNFEDFFMSKDRGSVFSVSYSTVHFADGQVSFTSNSIRRSDFGPIYGGAIYLNNSSFLNFERSTVSFIRNSANSSGETYGGAIEIANRSQAVFKDSTVIFSSNSAQYGGAVHFADDSLGILSFEHSVVVFSTNLANTAGGAIYAVNGSNVFFVDSTVQFTSNTSLSGGALNLSKAAAFFSASTISFLRNTSVGGNGGAIFAANSSSVSFSNSTIEFSTNFANKMAANGGMGGAL